MIHCVLITAERPIGYAQKRANVTMNGSTNRYGAAFCEKNSEESGRRGSALQVGRAPRCGASCALLWSTLNLQPESADVVWCRVYNVVVDDVNEFGKPVEALAGVVWI